MRRLLNSSNNSFRISVLAREHSCRWSSPRPPRAPRENCSAPVWHRPQDECRLCVRFLVPCFGSPEWGFPVAHTRENSMRPRSTLLIASLLALATACSDAPTATTQQNSQVDAILGCGVRQHRHVADRVSASRRTGCRRDSGVWQCRLVRRNRGVLRHQVHILAHPADTGRPVHHDCRAAAQPSIVAVGSLVCLGRVVDDSVHRISRRSSLDRQSCQ